MREIKFRAWYKPDKKMYEVEKLWWNEDEGLLVYFAGLWHGVSEVELMQYTELKDKNGSEIYEGDIIESERPHSERGTVGWSSAIGAWAWEHGEDWGMIFNESVCVVGNIYEREAG